jgi:site-specific DNA-cytosine methylase
MGAVVYSRLNEPPPNCTRWTPGRKGWVATHMTPEAAAARWGLDPDEVTRWAERYRDHGYAGLCETQAAERQPRPAGARMTRTAMVLFSGAANGWELGLQLAGVRTVAACEADPWRREVTANRWSIPVYDDVRTVTAARLEADGIARPWGLFGSPPCQDASEVNSKGKGVDGDQTGLFFEAIRLGAELRPSVLGLENVDRLRHRGLDRLCLALERIGYFPRPLVVGAGAVRGAHQRQRIWLLATDAARPQGRPAGQPWEAPEGPAAGRLGIRRPEDSGLGLEHFGPEAIGRRVQPRARSAPPVLGRRRMSEHRCPHCHQPMPAPRRVVRPASTASTRSPATPSGPGPSGRGC